MPSPRRPHQRTARRWTAALLAATTLAIPSLPVLGAVLDPGEPMVANARSGAERSRSVVVGTTVAPPQDEAAVLVAEVVRLANLERAAAGRAALGVHSAASGSAAAHSRDQAQMLRMTHTGSDGSNAGDRLIRAGFTWRTWGENVAVGQRSAAEVVRAWMGSAGHRANILNGTFTTIGVGVATGSDGRRYWTMVLAA